MTDSLFAFLRHALTWRKRLAEKRRRERLEAWDDLLRREGFVK